MTTNVYICPDCHVRVTLKPGESLDAAALRHLEGCPGPTVKPEHKRVTDVVPPEVLEGNFITIEDILGQEVLVTEINWRPSAYREDDEYLSLTVEIEGEERTLNTSAKRVVEVFRNVKLEELPIYCAFDKIRLPDGHRVYRVL